MEQHRRRIKIEQKEPLRMKAWLGIDPGKKGGGCFLFEDDSVTFIDYPASDNPFELFADFKSTLLHYNIQIVKTALERVHAMPEQGVTSMFSFGKNYGRWEMLLAARGIAYEDPTPQQWQKNLVRKSDSTENKHRSFLAASRLYPHLIPELQGSKGGIKDGRCDALLIAHYVKNKN